MLSDWAMRSLAKWSYEYIKMSCTDGKCYGVLAVSCTLPREDWVEVEAGLV